MGTVTRADILNRSVTERILLVEDIWDSIAGPPDGVTLTEETKQELDRRLDDYHRNPDAGFPWKVVQERIRSRA